MSQRTCSIQSFLLDGVHGLVEAMGGCFRSSSTMLHVSVWMCIKEWGEEIKQVGHGNSMTRDDRQWGPIGPDLFG